MGFQQFCGGQFWDQNLSWNTDYPDLSDCFQNTALIWIPCGFLLLASPIYYFCYLRYVTLPFTGGRRPSSRLQFLKKILTCMLVLVHVVSFVYNSIIIMMTDSQVGYHLVYIVSPTVQIISFAVSVILLDVEGKKRLVTSGVHFVFYLLLLISSVFVSASLISRAVRPEASSLAEPDTGRIIMISIHSFLVLIQFIIFCFADKNHYDSIPSTDNFKNRVLCPETQASFLSRLTFSWLTNLVVKGYRKVLTEKDLWSLNPRDVTEKGAELLLNNWNAELNGNKTREFQDESHPTFEEPERLPDESTPLFPGVSMVQGSSNPRPRKVSLLRAIIKSFGGHLLLSHFIKLFCDVLLMVGPLLQGFLIEFIESSTSASSFVQVWKGYLYACLFIINSLVYSILFQQVHFIGLTTGMRINASVIALVYKKALMMSSEARKTITVGEIVNLMSVDSQRLQDSFPYFWMLWSSPFQILLSLYFLWGLLGPSVLAGVAVIVLFIPLNAFVASLQKKLQVKQMKKKDERIKLMNEILNGIKVIKLYAWEESFEEKVDVVRNQELDTLRRFSYLGAFSTFAWSCAPFMVTLATFAAYILTGGVLEAKVAFTALSFFNILRFPISVFPMIIMMFVMTAVSLTRIEKFLQCQELSPENVQRAPSKDAITMTSGSFAWGTNDKPVLKDINLSIAKGSLVAVVGQVGSGKSSLISAMLGDMEKLEGMVNIDGTKAYVSQQAWIQNATLRDNILFGGAYQKDKYEKIIEACALGPDLLILPAGDMTEIGEKGINLSGGQKQRVSLARSLYMDSDIYLLDDPLSAVDSHVAKHIFSHVIGPAGYLKNKTRILVTHAVKFLPYTDHVIVLEDGAIVEQGSYNNLSMSGGRLTTFIESALDNQSAGEETTCVSIVPNISRSSLRKICGTNPLDGIEMISIKSRSLASSTGQRLDDEIIVMDDIEDDILSHVISPENVGAVTFGAYKFYASQLGYLTFALVVLFFVIFKSFAVMSNVWISYWTGDTALHNSHWSNTTANGSAGVDGDYYDRQKFYISSYAWFVAGHALFLICYCVAYVEGNISASKQTHSSMLHRIMRAPIAFFEATPIGRILNRFSRDLDVLDTSLPDLLNQWLAVVTSLLSTVIIITMSIPIFFPVALLLVAVFLLLQHFYLPTVRQLKWEESNSRSPIYALVCEALTGLGTIRAFKKQTMFIKKFDRLVNNNTIFNFAANAAERWLGFHLELMGAITTFAASMFSVFSRSILTGSTVGMFMASSIQDSFSLCYLVRLNSAMETNMVSMERLREYLQVEMETDPDNGDDDDDVETRSIGQKRDLIVRKKTKNQQLHERGKIEFKNYYMRYRPDLDYSLRNINVLIAPGEKVGIIGRTGAGKSSLISALFRFNRCVEGSILIDDVITSDLSLKMLRSSMTVLPQDPIIFSGTLRMNLDPLSGHTDLEIWDALRQVQMFESVKSLPGCLDFVCQTDGQNFSVGQRQLLCLGRTLLHKTTILILDEATAAVDLETDKVIQETIRTQFSDCTVLTIAHRINTILSCDRIMLLDNGMVEEYSSPGNISGLHNNNVNKSEIEKF